MKEKKDVNKEYWKNRIAKAQDRITSKNIKDIEKQLAVYYSKAMEGVIAEFENTYYKLLSTIDNGKEPTPANLYKIDKYWKMQAQLRNELNKLGEKQIALFSKAFEANFFEVYYSFGEDGYKAFTEISKEGAKQLINSIWVADGQTWDNRIWRNTDKLYEMLNDELTHCVITGKKTSDLKQLLQDSFSVSYNEANTLVQTEMAHIQTMAAQQRYIDAGIKKMQFWASPDERTCPKCGKLHEKIYYIHEVPPVPAHPRCRCCIIPVIEN